VSATRQARRRTTYKMPLPTAAREREEAEQSSHQTRTPSKYIQALRHSSETAARWREKKEPSTRKGQKPQRPRHAELCISSTSSQATDSSAPNLHTAQYFLFSCFSPWSSRAFRGSKEQAKQPAVPVRPSCQLPCSLPQNQSRHTRPTTARCRFACTEIGTRRCDRSFSRFH
jgi:hypothetical protein